MDLLLENSLLYLPELAELERGWKWCERESGKKWHKIFYYAQSRWHVAQQQRKIEKIIFDSTTILWKVFRESRVRILCFGIFLAKQNIRLKIQFFLLSFSLFDKNYVYGNRGKRNVENSSDFFHLSSTMKIGFSNVSFSSDVSDESSAVSLASNKLSSNPRHFRAPNDATGAKWWKYCTSSTSHTSKYMREIDICQKKKLFIINRQRRLNSHFFEFRSSGVFFFHNTTKDLYIFISRFSAAEIW